MIIGCDFHPRYQQIAMMDTETGELVERRLEHEKGEARTFYASLPKPARLVNKQEMMDLMAKTDRQPGTGAFPDHFKLMAVYGNVALATDHTVIKGVDANGKIVVVREMGVLRMFVKEKGKWRVAGAGLVPVVAQ